MGDSKSGMNKMDNGRKPSQLLMALPTLGSKIAMKCRGAQQLKQPSAVAQNLEVVVVNLPIRLRVVGSGQLQTLGVV